MLDGYGLHALIWNLADQVVSDILVASPMDAQGRGIALEVREAGVAADFEREMKRIEGWPSSPRGAT